MSRLGEKYIAGFLDSDGSIIIQWQALTMKNIDPTHMRASINLKFNQKTSKDEVLMRIQEAIGGKISYRKDEHGEYTILTLTGKAAQMVLSRIHKHLVIKRHIAGVALEMHGKDYNRKEATALWKQHRKVKSLPLPNFPTRQWLAGYFDGDGSFGSRFPKNRKSAQFSAVICCSDYDSEGIELIQKVFGGSICPLGKQDQLRQYTLTLPPSKAKQFIGYFGKHLINKKPESEFILGCAEMGHYRDGKSINSAMKQLKTHPHRLNESRQPTANLLDTVRDIPMSDTYPRLKRATC